MLRFRRRSKDVILITGDSFAGYFIDGVWKPEVPAGDLQICKGVETLLLTISDDQFTDIYLKGGLTPSVSPPPTGLRIKNASNDVVAVLDADGNWHFRDPGPTPNRPTPLPPSDLEATLRSCQCVDLFWTNSVKAHDGFVIKRRTRQADGTYSAYTQISKLQDPAKRVYEDRTVQRGTEYCYQVCSYSKDLESPPSNEASVLTGLSTPERLSATVEKDYILLTWADMPADWRSSGMIIERSDTGKDEDFLTIVNERPRSSSYSDSNLTPTYDEYSYRVRAYDANTGSHSEWSLPTGVRSRKFTWCKKELESLASSTWYPDKQKWTIITPGSQPFAYVGGYSSTKRDESRFDVFTDFEDRRVEVAYLVQEKRGYDSWGKAQYYSRWESTIKTGKSSVDTSMMSVRQSWSDFISLPCSIRVSKRTITEYQQEEVLKELRLVITELAAVEDLVSGQTAGGQLAKAVTAVNNIRLEVKNLKAALSG